MNVAARAVGLQHLRIAAVERAYAQLNLGKVAGNENVSLGREDKGADAHRVVGLARAVLHIGIPGGKPARFRRQRQKVGMNAPCGRIDEAQVAVDVGGFQLRPAPVFLHHFKQRHQLRAIFRAPFCQHGQRLVVRSLSVFRGRLEYRQTQLLEQIILERLRSGVGSDVHVADHAANLLP